MRLINLKIFRKEVDKKGKIALLVIALMIIFVSIYYYSKQDDYKPIPTEKKLQISEDVPQPLEKFEDFGLLIESLKISAPIIPNVNMWDDKIYLKAIQKGVALSQESKTPDNEGNLFIFGHSEYYAKAPGEYKEIFKELDGVKKGDKIKIYYQKIPYTYEVTESKKVNPDDLSILDPTPKDSKDRTVTLMTCYPPGTTDKRWVIFAKQI